MRLRDQVRTVRDLIRRSDVVELIEEQLAATAKSAAGRRRESSTEGLLVGLVVAALRSDSKRVRIRDAHRLLTSELPVDLQRSLGVDGLSESQAYYLFSRIAEAFDPTGTTSGITDTAERTSRAEALQRLVDQLLAATIPAGTGHEGSYAIDGSLLASAARPRRSSQRSRDPDASWQTVKKPDKTQEHTFGYALHASVFVSEDNSAADVPTLAARITVTDAKSGYAAPERQALKMLTDITDAGGPLSDVIVDRGYSYRQAKNFAIPVRQLGAELVFDLHANQRGVKGSVNGALMIDGWLYSPSLPEGLRRIHRPGASASKEKKAEFAELIAERNKYAFRALTSLDSDMYMRVQCPASAGRVRCPLVPKSLSLTPSKLTVVNTPAAPGPDCCTQSTVTVPFARHAGTFQKHRWGTPEWAASYGRRSRVEGWFGVFKGHEGGTRKGLFMVMGLAKVTLAVTVAAVANNLQLVDRWQTRTAKAASHPVATKRTRARRRKHSIDQVAAAEARAP